MAAHNLIALGIALHELGRIEEARTRFRQALTVDPSYREAQRRLDETVIPRP